jgi:hypothetical protein
VPARRDAIAARNNAEWCAAVWKAHGLPVEQRHGLWFCGEETPQFYPNVVTVDPDADPQDQTGFIQELAQQSAFEFSVKDSFASLPLADAGLKPLFSATWLWREPADASPLSDDLRWRRIQVPDLEPWERAWRGDGATGARTFPDDLLHDTRVRVVGGFDALDQIVGGGIAFQAADVLGLTNVFGSQTQVMAALASLLPPAPIIAYQPGDDLTHARRRGFAPLGPLIVWRAPPKPAAP